MLNKIPPRWFAYYLAIFLFLFIACVLGAKFLIRYPIWHDILLVVSGLFLAGFFSIAAVMRAKGRLVEQGEDIDNIED